MRRQCNSEGDAYVPSAATSAAAAAAATTIVIPLEYSSNSFRIAAARTERTGKQLA